MAEVIELAPREDEALTAFRADVLMGLALAQKAVPARYFYDRRGSELFEAITDLPEYYPTRTEVGLLEDMRGELAELLPDDLALVEFGAGSLMKVGRLLETLSVAHYVPIDISGDFLRDCAARIADQNRDVDVIPVEADFSNHVRLPQAIGDSPRLGFFPGSTIGNLVPRDAVDLLRRMHGSLGLGSHLLIGLDRVKPLETLIAAYDDAAGVTAAFNLNLLDRIDRELDGTIDVGAFRHEARWNEQAARIEMHLVAKRDIAFEVAGERFTMNQGESLHTENSHKYGEISATTLLRSGGWRPVRVWTDAEDRFFLILAEAIGDHIAP